MKNLLEKLNKSLQEQGSFLRFTYHKLQALLEKKILIIGNYVFNLVVNIDNQIVINTFIKNQFRSIS